MSTYVLGHSPRERDRLDLQGQIYQDATRRALLDAGVGVGMRALDVGCGSGDVTRLVANLVGPTGFVYGVDRNDATIADARQRAARHGIHNVSFEVGDIADYEENTFDAVVGRFVLMHQRDPADVLARVAGAVRSAGVIAFIESYMVGLRDGVHSFPRSPVYDELVQWKCRVVEAAGADISAGFRLHGVFRRAGLPEPNMRVEAPLIGDADSPYYRYMEESVRSMLPQAQSLGIQGFDDARVNRIEHDLRTDVLQRDGVLVAWPIVAAWCRNP